MKRNEVALLLVIVGLVVLTTFFLLNSFFSEAALREVSVKTTEAISSDIAKPDPTVFNKEAINPAVSITIGNQLNQQPFTIGQ